MVPLPDRSFAGFTFRLPSSLFMLSFDLLTMILSLTRSIVRPFHLGFMGQFVRSLVCLFDFVVCSSFFIFYSIPSFLFSYLLLIVRFLVWSLVCLFDRTFACSSVRSESCVPVRSCLRSIIRAMNGSSI